MHRAEGSQAGSEAEEGAPVELSDDAAALKEELDKIKVEPPAVMYVPKLGEICQQLHQHVNLNLYECSWTS